MDAKFVSDYLDGKIAYSQLEERVNDFWADNKIFTIAQEQLKNAPIFCVLQSPLPVGNLTTPLATSLIIADIHARYKFLTGFKQYWLHSFSCFSQDIEEQILHGLGLRYIEEIEDLPPERKHSFVQKCQEKTDQAIRALRQQFEKLGVQSDLCNSHYTYSDQNIEQAWQFLAKCFGKGYLSFSRKVGYWCNLCKKIVEPWDNLQSSDAGHNGLYFSLPLIGEKNRRIVTHLNNSWHLLTLSGLAVNPDYEYCEVPWNGVRYIVGRKNAVKIFGSDFVTEHATKGTDLVGRRVLMPILDEAKLIVGHNIDPEERSGIIALTPALNQRHLDIAETYNLQPIEIIDENNRLNWKEWKDQCVNQRYSSSSIERYVKEKLQELGFFIKATETIQDTITCADCKSPTMPRILASWFLSIKSIKIKVFRGLNKSFWADTENAHPMAKTLSAVSHLHIKRKGLWGTPLPFYHCASCGISICISSKKHLEERAKNTNAVKKMSCLLAPQLDQIQITCPNCKSKMEREEGSVAHWVDTAVIPFALTKYVDAVDKDCIKDWRNFVATHNWLPSDLAIDHTKRKSWIIYSSIVATIEEDMQTTYQIYCCNKPTNERNCAFNQLPESNSADLSRLALILSPGEQSSYYLETKIKEVKKTIDHLICCCLRFSKQFSETINDSADIPEKKDFLDDWLHARFQNSVNSIYSSFQKFQLVSAFKELENLISDTVDWYLNLKNDKLHGYFILKNVIIILAPFAPYISEVLWQTTMRKICPSLPISVFLKKLPHISRANQDIEILYDFKIMQKIVDSISFTRIGRTLQSRHILPRLLINPADICQRDAITRIHGLIAKQLNVAGIEFVAVPSQEVLLNCVSAQTDGMRIWLDLNLEGDLLHANLAKEIVYTVNRLKNYSNDEIVIFADGSPHLTKMLEDYRNYIKQETNAWEILTTSPPANAIKEMVSMGKSNFTVGIIKQLEMPVY